MAATIRGRSAVLPLLMLGILAGGCGATSPVSPSSPTPSLSSTNIQTLAKQFAQAGTSGATNGYNQGVKTAGGTSAVLDPRTITCNASGCQIFQQYSQTFSCNGGSGRVSMVGQISGSITNGTLGPFGNISLSETDSIVDWRCLGNWAVNGDPYLSDVGTIAITGNHESFRFHQSGGWIAVNGAARVSCQQNTDVTWDSTTNGVFSGSVTCVPGGTVSVSGSF